MYYEEKVIDGVMHWRSNPRAQFEPMTLEMLTKKLLIQREENKMLKEGKK